MNYLSVAETAKKWNISERSVRNYCAQERIPGAVLIGKTWHIPENAEKPARSNGKKITCQNIAFHSAGRKTNEVCRRHLSQNPNRPDLQL